MIKSLRERMKRVALLAGIVLTCGNPASADMCEFGTVQAVADHELESMRGGYLTESGLQISMGIIKTVAVDGVLKTVSTWSIPQLTKADSAVYSASTGINSQPIDAATLVQNLGNAILVQNRADGANIRSTTILNVTGNMKSMFNLVNLADRINQQMVNMLR